MAEYDEIARQYRDSKQLSFRDHIERFTLFLTIGDIRGARVLDFACGDGFYTRLLKQAGAYSAVGVDVSREMILLAKENERKHPLGCQYIQSDAAAYQHDEPVDLVLAAYLLNYAQTREDLVGFCRTCWNSLKPGGRFVGVNDNPFIPSEGPLSYLTYGFDRGFQTFPPREGDVIQYTFPSPDGTSFGFKNYFHKPTTYEQAFREAGYSEFQWVPVALEPSQQENAYWDVFMDDPPIIGFSATK